MTAMRKPKPGALPPDPRGFDRIPVARLTIDQRKQRECDPEKVAKIANEFEWSRFEALTVARSRTPGMFDVVEGQHRTLSVRLLSEDAVVPCMIITDRATDKEQAQLAHDIVTGRRGHTAYELWRLRYNAGHPHEIYATAVLDGYNLRVGKGASAATIGAVATVRRIVHGGNFTPEVGAKLLDEVLDVITRAFPTHDHESNVSRWDRWILLAVAMILMRWPDVDHGRLASSLRVRPAGQWVNLGKGTESASPDAAIVYAVLGEYNRGRRRGRLE